MATVTSLPVVETNVTWPGANRAVLTLSNPGGVFTAPWMNLTADWTEEDRRETEREEI